MENYLKRVFNLVRKTGDTMIVVDKEGNDSFVVMDLDQYEMLLGSQLGYEDDDSQDFEGTQEEKPEVGAKIWDVMQGAGEEGDTWDIDQLSQEEYTDLEKQYQTFASRQVQETVEEVPKTNEQEKAPKVQERKQDDEYGEEQFYLEPVE